MLGIDDRLDRYILFHHVLSKTDFVLKLYSACVISMSDEQSNDLFILWFQSFLLQLRVFFSYIELTVL